MRMALAAFGMVTALAAFMMFGSYAIAKAWKHFGGSQDDLAFTAIGFVLLAGLFLMAWKSFEVVS